MTQLLLYAAPQSPAPSAVPSWPSIVSATTEALMTAHGPGGDYDPSHPWFYVCGGRPVPAPDVGPGPGSYDLFLPRKLPKSPAKAAAVLRDALAVARRECAEALRGYCRQLAEPWSGFRFPGVCAAGSWDDGWDALLTACSGLAHGYSRVACARGVAAALVTKLGEVTP